MQDCFRQYPEVYGSEIDSDDAEDEDDMTADLAAPSDFPSDSVSSDVQTAPTSSQRPRQSNASREPALQPHSAEKVEANRRELGLVPDNYQPEPKGDARSVAPAESTSNPKPNASSSTERANQARQQVKSQEQTSESESLVPKAAHDAGDANTEKLQRK